ncbi:MAG: nucleotidyltransferase domain-containing protein [Chloroflexota bacterium]
MRERSYGSAKTVWLDREQILAETRRAVTKLGKDHPEISRVILFGSMASGDAAPGSDVDLMVEVDETDIRFLDRSLAYRVDGVSIGVDVFVYTRAEVEQMVADNAGIPPVALKDGLVLFQRDAG